MRGRNLIIALVVLVILILVAVIIMKEPAPEKITASFPEIKKDNVTKVWIRRPDIEKKKPGKPEEEKKKTDEKPKFEELALEKEGLGEDAMWMVTSPVRYEAYPSYVDSLLGRLEELEVEEIAAEKKDSYKDLEIDDNNAVEVKIYTGKTEAMRFFIGAYKGGATMVRFPDDEKVYRVRGSIRYIFAKPVKDWREKRIINIENDRVTRLEFSSDNGSFAFSRVEGEWSNESETEIEDYDPKKVNGFVSTVAHLRATDFEDSKTPADVGLTEGTGRVTYYYTEKEEEEEEEKEEETAAEPANEEGEEAGSEEEAAAGEEGAQPEEKEALSGTILIGDKKDDSNYYIMVEGKDQIFLISKYTAERLKPPTEKFSKPKKKETDETAATAKAPADAGAFAKPADGGKIPPDVMKQLQAEIKRQKLMKQLANQPK